MTAILCSGQENFLRLLMANASWSSSLLASHWDYLQCLAGRHLDPPLGGTLMFLLHPKSDLLKFPCGPQAS